jgi:hypothetical protein
MRRDRAGAARQPPHADLADIYVRGRNGTMVQLMRSSLNSRPRDDWGTSIGAETRCFQYSI